MHYNCSFYKQINFLLEPRNFTYDIYWADPRIIFSKEIKASLPLAKTTFPKFIDDNPRISLHNKLTIQNKNVFEAVIAHEIGIALVTPFFPTQYIVVVTVIVQKR